MELDQVPASQRLIFLFARLPPQVPGSHLRNRNGFLLLGVVGLRQGNGDVGLFERRNLIVVGILGIGLVGRAVGEMQMQSLRALG